MKISSKILSILVFASMVLSLIPAVNATTSVTLSVSNGPVGTEVTCSGVIETYNGNWELFFDADGDNAFVIGERLATGTATGYSWSKAITVPNAYEGAKKFLIRDVTAAPIQESAAFFTVQTKWTIKTDASSYYQGGGFGAIPTGVVITATITGGKKAWATPAPPAPLLNLRYRVKDPTGTTVLQPTSLLVPEVGGAIGKFVGTTTILPADVNLIKNGVYTVNLDWDDVTPATWPSAQQGVVTTTFNIYITDKISYERTEDVYVRYYVPAGKTVDQWVLEKPDGSTVPTLFGPVIGPAFTAVLNPLQTDKDTALGTYRVKLRDTTSGDTIVTQEFSVITAYIKVSIVAAPDFQETSSYETSANIVAANQDVERMHTVNVKYTLQYPDNTFVSQADVQAGFDVKVYYNTTLVTTFHLDPLTAYLGAGLWKAAWKIPKDAVKGKGYTMNVTASTITDIYGNSGPKKNYGSMSIWKFATKAATIYVTTAATLLYPGTGNEIERTVEARASVEVKYPDGTRVIGSDMSQFNVTAFTVLGAKTYTVKPAATDYNSDIGLWVAKWKTPYNAPIQLDYVFTVNANNFKDTYGNKGPNYAKPGQAAQANSLAFGIKAATITVSDLNVDSTSYETDEEVTVTFKASYPSGDPVTTANAVPANTWQKVDIIDSGGAVVGGATKQASYNSATQLWKLKFIIPSGSVGGTWNATVKANYVLDDASNAGPVTKKYVNFDVSRISMTNVMAAAEAAEAAAVLAQTKADAAKTAADTAGTKADAAKTAATAAQTAATAAQTAATAAQTAATGAQTTAQSAVTAATDAKTAAQAAQTAATAAGTKADAATAAANAAKTSADAAAAAANNLTTMVYVAIAASVVAALAAIFAVMQINKKIA